MFKKNNNLYLTVILIAVIAFALMTIYSASSTKERTKSFGLSAEAATLYQPDTECFLYEKNADEPMPMASTTKIMTALVALENSELSELVYVKASAVGIEGSSAYLKEGDTLTMEELLYALLLGSANDAAVAIAEHISADVDSFVSLMNERAESLGLTNTHFVNPHGLDDEEHCTTARELALIAAEALKNDNFKKISSTYKKTFSSEERTRTYVNHNKLLKLYDGSIGMKTGFTKRSGRCLVGAAERDGLTLVSVTLNAPSDWSDHAKLFDYGYDTLECITLAEVSEYCYDIAVLDGAQDVVTVENHEAASVILEKGQHEVKKYVKLPRLTVAPIHGGEALGTIIFTVDGEYAAQIPLVASESVKVKEKQKILDRLKEKFGIES